MLGFEQDTGAEVNRIKSGVVASHKDFEKELEEATGELQLKALPDLKDLGVVQGTGQDATAEAGGRWEEACHRFSRLERVPLKDHSKGIMGGCIVHIRRGVRLRQQAC